MFTIAECNELIPVLTQLLTELQKKRDEVNELEAQVDAMELVCDSENPRSVEALDRLIESHQGLVAEFYTLVDHIHEHGCFLKDVDLGLIDFYGVIDQRMVCLCWRLGENEVGFWHEVDEGYAGRQPLDVG